MLHSNVRVLLLQFVTFWHSFDDKEKQKLFQFVRTDLGDLNKLMEDKLRVIILLPYIAKYDLPRIVVMHFFSQPVRHRGTKAKKKISHNENPTRWSVHMHKFAIHAV